MSEKYKVLRSAEKYVITGKFAQAVKEYQKLLAKEPDEPTLLNTVGDLLLKQNNRDEALNYFRRAAEVYLRNGFLLKSIAVYKKIYQFNPADTHVNESLADLYQRQGLVYEASRHLKILIHQHAESGKVDQASLYLQRLAQLSPNSPETQVELAELLQKRHDEAGAFEHYQAAAALYLQVDCPSQAFEAATKAIEIDPTDDRTVELYVSGGLKSGNKQVVRNSLKELIEKTGQRLPYEIFLAQILEEEGNSAAAHAKYLELEPLAYTDSRIREGLSRTLTKSAAEETEETGTSGNDFTFDEPRTRIREVATGRPDWVQGGERFEEQRDQAHHSGLGADASFQASPQPGNLFAPAVSATPPSDSLWHAETPAAEEEEDEPFEGVEEDEAPVEVEVTPIESLDEALQEADFYLKLGFREEAKKLLERLLHTYPRDERVRRRAEKVMTIPPEFDVGAEPVELFPPEEIEESKRAARPKEPETEAVPPPGPSWRTETSADVDEDAAFADFLRPHAEPEAELPLEELFGHPPAEESAEEEPAAEPADETQTELSGIRELPWDEGESAVSTFDLDFEAPELSLEMPAAEDVEPAQPAEVLDLDLELPEPQIAEEAAEEAPRAEEFDFLLDLKRAEAAAEQEAAEQAAAEEPLELDLEEAEGPQPDAPADEAATEELPLLEIGAVPAPVQTADLFQLEEVDEAPTARAQITEPEFDEEIDSALDSLFSGEPLEEAPEEVLRYDVAATGSSDEATNPKVHYDLGLAYKEMGLVEDAVQEFQTAAQLLNSPIYNPQRILCCSMLANSLLQLGHYSEAFRWAEEGLRIPGKKEFEWKALKYDWSSALERQGKYPAALDGFREILDRDPEYRDVLTRIDNLLRIQ